MVNNALIQGAAKTGKQFLDVGAAAAKGLSGYNSGSATPANDRAAKNKAIQSNVNNYMSNLKTDMDFTSFSPEETRTMRNFLMSQRTEYANAAKEAAKLGDTSSPEYMQYVDVMQNVNNSFKNMASQIGAYKKGKVDYAENQLSGMYSNGNGDANKNAAIIYGFADVDNDGKKDPGMNAPFKILQGGNLGFDLNGVEVSYNDMEQPFFKDNKLALGILKDNESIYNKGTQGGEINPEMLKSYKANLEAQLQNRNTLKSIIFDFESELDTKSVADRIDAGTLDWDDARNEVVNLLVNARQDVFNEGKKQYTAKQNKANTPNNNPGTWVMSKNQSSKNEEESRSLNTYDFNNGPKTFSYVVRMPGNDNTTAKNYTVGKKGDVYFVTEGGISTKLDKPKAKAMFNLDLPN